MGVFRLDLLRLQDHFYVPCKYALRVCGLDAEENRVWHIIKCFHRADHAVSWEWAHLLKRREPKHNNFIQRHKDETLSSFHEASGQDGLSLFDYLVRYFETEVFISENVLLHAFNPVAMTFV